MYPVVWIIRKTKTAQAKSLLVVAASQQKIS